MDSLPLRAVATFVATMSENNRAYLFIEEAAELLGVRESSVRFWIRTGKLSAIKPGRRVLIEKRRFQELLENSRLPVGREMAERK